MIGSEKAAAGIANPAWIHGTAMRSEPTTAAERDHVDPQAGQLAAASVFKQAGITNPIEEIDCAEIYVPFSWFEPMGWRIWALPPKAKVGSSPRLVKPPWVERFP
ncbi:MAG: hypothetical protein R2709_02700 [Marmoricola sp.]